MTPNRPYLIRAFYEWIVDNGLTPYVLVNATLEGVIVPEKYIKDGQIVLNVSPQAVEDLHMTNEIVHFDARFSGTLMHVVVPVFSVVAIYAHENARGMVFTEEEEGGGDDTPPPPETKQKTKPKLTVVK